MKSADRLISPAAAGKLLNCSARTSIRLLQEGKLKGCLVGARHKIFLKSVYEYINAQVHEFQLQNGPYVGP